MREIDRVQCSACNAENREGRIFCAQCGAAASVRAEAWDEVERHARSLEAYMSAEPLPWCQFYIARGRALAAAGSEPSDAALAELDRLRAEAKAKSLLIALPALEQAPVN